jgi:hypothetical protein
MIVRVREDAHFNEQKRRPIRPDATLFAASSEEWEPDSSLFELAAHHFVRSNLSFKLGDVVRRAPKSGGNRGQEGA